MPFIVARITVWYESRWHDSKLHARISCVHPN